MTSRQPAASTAAANTSQAPLPEWMAEAAAQGVKPEQALAFIGLGLMQKMAGSGNDLPWICADSDDGGRADLAALRQRLELTQLALQTGAPLTTAEVSQLLGVRPTSESVERAGIRARRLSRNVWKLVRAEGADSRSDDAFRRRF